MRFDKVQNMTDKKAKEIMMKHMEKKISKMGHSEIFQFFNEEFENDDNVVVLYSTGLPKIFKEDDFFIFAKGHTSPNKDGQYLLIEEVANDSMIITKYVRKKDHTVPKIIGYKIQIKNACSADHIASIKATNAKTDEIKSLIKTISGNSSIIWESGVWPKKDQKG